MTGPALPPHPGMSHGNHGPPQPHPGSFVPPSLPQKGVGVKGKKRVLGVGLGSVCSVVSVAIHSGSGACRDALRLSRWRAACTRVRLRPPRSASGRPSLSGEQPDTFSVYGRSDYRRGRPFGMGPQGVQAEGNALGNLERFAQEALLRQAEHRETIKGRCGTPEASDRSAPPKKKVAFLSSPPWSRLQAPRR